MRNGAAAREAGEEAPLRLRAGARHAGLRADEFLFAELPFLSRTRIRQKIQTGEGLLNGRRCATSARLREGDEITVQIRLPAAQVPQPQAPPLAVLYEDDFLVALDKPAGIASHPMGGRQAGTVIQQLRDRFAADVQESLETDGDFYPSLVNRLDFFTSGVILAAKTRTALRAMLALVRERRVDKRYTALVEGVVGPDEGTISCPLRRDAESPTGVRIAVRPDGLPSVTQFTVLRRLAHHTLLGLRPLTGRQHQVRAHCAAIGHPVWGDLIYKDETLFLRWREGDLSTPLPPRHCLHAWSFSFIHPLTGGPVRIRSPLPPDFTAILRDCSSP